MALLSDGAFKVYMHVRLTADRSTGRMKLAHGDIATALKRSRRSIANYLEELRQHEICNIEAARNQPVAGTHRGVRPLRAVREVLRRSGPRQTLASYVDAIHQLLAARKCVNPVFNPADKKVAAQMFRNRLTQSRSSMRFYLPASGGTS
jgi:hypothetical protein